MRGVRLCPAVTDAVTIVRPETLIRWHRRGFRAYWRWKSRSRGGRPATPKEVRELIRQMSRANWLWGAPRIHGELLAEIMFAGLSPGIRRRGPEMGSRGGW